MASDRWRAAATVISRRSLTLGWPVKSENSDGRNVNSSATSGLVNTSEMVRSVFSAIEIKHGSKQAWATRQKRETWQCLSTGGKAPNPGFQRGTKYFMEFP